MVQDIAKEQMMRIRTDNLTNTNTGNGFKAYVKVSDGVLNSIQSVDNGAIQQSGVGYEKILNKSGFVRIFDYNKGNGASGYVSKVDANGGILEITVQNGGENYNDLDKNTSVIYILPEYNGFEHDGYGFKSNFLVTADGVVNGYEIVQSGDNYTLDTFLIPVERNQYNIWKAAEGSEIKVTLDEDSFKQMISEEVNQVGFFKCLVIH